MKTTIDKDKLEQFKDYQNEWVALDKNSDIIANGDSVTVVEDKLKKNKMHAAVITFVTPLNEYLSP